MDWWEKMVFPMKRAWIRISKRLGIRKKGLLKLRHDVRSCEYEDVRIMWELLIKAEEMHDLPITSNTTTTTKRRRRPFWKMSKYAPHSFCRSF